MHAYTELYLRKEMYCPMEWLIENELSLERLEWAEFGEAAYGLRGYMRGAIGATAFGVS